MKINRNNYELYFMDYLDGNLSDHDILMLENFLLINPDLRTELEGTENIILTPEKFEYNYKEVLKRPDLSLPVNENNFEDFCVAETEGDLNDQQRSSLAEFLRQNPRFENIFTLFSRLHLIPDNSIIFPVKEKLKKKLVLIPEEILYSFLAVAAILTIALILNFHNRDNNIRSLNVELPSVKSKSLADTPEINKKSLDVQASLLKVQQSPAIAFTTPKEKKQTKEISEVKYIEKEPGENINVLPPQILNPSFQLKLPAVIDNQVTVPTIERGKVIYPKGNYTQTKAEYLNIAEFARKEFKEKILGSKDKDFDHLSAWQIADAGIAEINKITKGELKLQKRTDEKGNITSYSFNSRYLSFSSTR